MAEIRAAFPARAALCEQRDRRRADRLPRAAAAPAPSGALAAGQIPRGEPGRGRGASSTSMDHPDSLRPTRPVDRAPADMRDRRPARSGQPRAASPRPRATSGSTTARRGWSSPATWWWRRCRSWTPPARKAGAAALDEIAATPFATLDPRPWRADGPGRVPRLARAPFNAFCSTAAPRTGRKADCVAGWRRDAAALHPGRASEWIDEHGSAIIRQPAARRAGGAAAATASRSLDSSRPAALNGRISTLSTAAEAA